MWPFPYPRSANLLSQNSWPTPCTHLVLYSTLQRPMTDVVQLLPELLPLPVQPLFPVATEFTNIWLLRELRRSSVLGTASLQSQRSSGLAPACEGKCKVFVTGFPVHLSTLQLSVLWDSAEFGKCMRTAMSAALRKLPFPGSLTPSTGFGVERECIKGGGASRVSWPD